MMNFIDSTPPKGAFCGSKGRGPFRKNFVTPKELANRLIKKLIKEIGSLFKRKPSSFFG